MICISTTRASAGLKNRSLVPCPWRPTQVGHCNATTTATFVQLSTSLPPLATFPSANGSIGFVPALPCTSEPSYPDTPFSFSFDRRSQLQQLQQQQCIEGGVGGFTQLPFDELSPPTSARPSTTGGTQDLVAATQAAVYEAAGRFAPYAESGVLSFGRDSAPFGGINPFNLSGVAMLNMLPFQAFGGFDSTTTASASVVGSAAGAGTEIGGLVGIPTEWGATVRLLGTSRKLAPSGVGMALGESGHY